MKKTCINFFAFALILALFASCSKYDEGPWISFRSETKRLNNEWQVQVFKIYLNDTTIGWKTHYDWKYTFNLPEEGLRDEGSMYVYAPKPFCSASTYSEYDGTGYWKMEENFTVLTMKYWFYDPIDTTQTVGDSCGIWPLISQKEISFDIAKLRNDELWLRYELGGDTIVSIRFEEN